LKPGYKKNIKKDLKKNKNISIMFTVEKMGVKYEFTIKFIIKDFGLQIKNLSSNQKNKKYLLAKIVQIIAFKNHNEKQSSTRFHYVDFPLPIKNNIPEKPSVSIVIPAYIKNKKDIANIENLLQSIEKQTIKPDHVIIVDDCSPVQYPFSKRIQLFKQPKNSGPAKARNLGKQIAVENQSDIIAFTDTDCLLSENWIEIIIRSFHNLNDFQILSGNTISYDKNWLGIYQNINGTLNGRKFKDSERLLYGTTANLAITKEVAERINFNEVFPLAAGEDIEFCYRANQIGFAIKHISVMKIFHNYGYNNNLLHDLKLFYKQFKRYEKGQDTLLVEVPEYYTYFDNTIEIQASI